MKRYMRGFVAAITSLAFMGGVASAQTPTTCADGEATITNTGPGSVNEIECVDSREIKVTCSNNIYVVNDNSQTGGSGNANNSGNTTGGNSISGSATNENGATVQIGASCAAEQPAAVTPEAPTPSQPVGGMGAGAPVPVTAIAALPNTSNNTLLDNVLIGSAGLASLLIASRLGTAAYRRLALK